MVEVWKMKNTVKKVKVNITLDEEQPEGAELVSTSTPQSRNAPRRATEYPDPEPDPDPDRNRNSDPDPDPPPDPSPEPSPASDPNPARARPLPLPLPLTLILTLTLTPTPTLTLTLTPTPAPPSLGRRLETEIKARPRCCYGPEVRSPRSFQEQRGRRQAQRGQQKQPVRWGLHGRLQRQRQRTARARRDLVRCFETFHTSCWRVLIRRELRLRRSFTRLIGGGVQA